MKKSMKLPIVMVERLDSMKMISPTADSEYKNTIRSYSGSTISEMKSDFEAKAEFSGGKCGFSAEINATFNMKDFSNEQYEYAMTYVDVVNERIMIMASAATLKECLIPAAYDALNGISVEYPSTEAGFAALIKEYGTHVVRYATLGGRLKIATKINTSKVTKEYDLQAFAKASYSGVVDVSASVDENYKQSYEENKNSCETTISATGGDRKYVTQMATLSGDALKDNILSWTKDISENEGNSSAVYIGIDGKDDLIPIYDLVKDPKRAELLKEYIESGAYQKETEPIYDFGVQARISEVSDLIKKMNGNDYKGSLVKNICIGNNNNKVVAVLCSEYIPEIDKKGRVAVFYPVINGDIRFNMGLFVGNEYYKPSKVSNYAGQMRIIPYGDKNVEEYISIYFRGPSITLEPIDADTPVLEANIEDYNVSMWKGSTAYNYPVVKVRNNLWLRETYASDMVKGGTFVMSHVYNGNYYFELGQAPSGVPSRGWVLPTVGDANILLALLKKHNTNGDYEAFKSNGLFGIDVENLGRAESVYPAAVNDFPIVRGWDHAGQGTYSYFALQKPSGPSTLYPYLEISAGSESAKISEESACLYYFNWPAQKVKNTSIRFVKPIL